MTKVFNLNTGKYEEENTQVELPDWQKRLLEEYRNLNKYYKLSGLEQKLLDDQLAAMHKYQEILKYRLDFYHIGPVEITEDDNKDGQYRTGVGH